MDETVDSEKFQMTTCPVCAGYGLICSPDDVKVCQSCGGFGFINKEGEVLIEKTNQSEQS